MISIKECVDEIVSENLFLEDSLYHDYLNLSSFALYIRPRIMQMTKKEVTIWSIKIALSRISKEKQKAIQYKRICPDNIFMRKNITIITLNNNECSDYLIRKVQVLKKYSDKNYFWIIQWINETDIIFSKYMKEGIENIISDDDLKLKVEWLWLIWINLDEKLLNTVWLIYSLTKQLAFYNISVVNMLSTYTEIVFVINKDDLKKAFEVLIV